MNKKKKIGRKHCCAVYSCLVPNSFRLNSVCTSPCKQKFRTVANPGRSALGSQHTSVSSRADRTIQMSWCRACSNLATPHRFTRGRNTRHDVGWSERAQSGNMKHIPSIRRHLARRSGNPHDTGVCERRAAPVCGSSQAARPQRLRRPSCSCCAKAAALFVRRASTQHYSSTTAVEYALTFEPPSFNSCRRVNRITFSSGTRCQRHSRYDMHGMQRLQYVGAVRRRPREGVLRNSIQSTNTTYRIWSCKFRISPPAISTPFQYSPCSQNRLAEMVGLRRRLILFAFSLWLPSTLKSSS